MFDRLTINTKSQFNNPGILTESLIFYQKTNLILDPGSLEDTLRYCGYNNLVELAKSGQLSLNFTNYSLGAGNSKDNIFLISSLSVTNRKKSITIREAVENVYGRNISANNMAIHINKIVENHEYSENFMALLKKELEDTENLISAITIVTEGKLNRNDIQLKVEEVDTGFYNIESNVDNNIITKAALLISKGSGDIFDAEIYDSGLVTNYRESNYSEHKINRIIQRRLKDEKAINTFHEMVLPEFVDLKGTINSGSKDFNDFMQVWREAQKFKEWLKNEEPSVELLTAYIRKLSEKTWLDKVPIKNMRWLLFAGIGTLLGGEFGGVIGTATGLSIDYFDDLILDRLLKNWKPDQYVDGEYKDFLNLRI